MQGCVTMEHAMGYRRYELPLTRASRSQLTVTPARVTERLTSSQCMRWLLHVLSLWDTASGFIFPLFSDHRPKAQKG